MSTRDQRTVNTAEFGDYNAAFLPHMRHMTSAEIEERRIWRALWKVRDIWKKKRRLAWGCERR